MICHKEISGARLRVSLEKNFRHQINWLSLLFFHSNETRFSGKKKRTGRQKKKEKKKTEKLCLI